MLYHVSFNARDPRTVAHVLADLLEALAVRAPSPPFPRDGWFVCLGDANGSLIEVMPWGETRDATAARGVSFDVGMRPSSGAHVLAGTKRSTAAVLAIAERAGWRAEISDAGLFKFVKVWVENAFLVEFLTPEFRRAYVAAFDAAGVETIDRKLRELERALSAGSDACR